MARATASLKTPTDQPQLRPQFPPRGKGIPVPVIAPDGRYFPSLLAAAAVVGVFPSTLCQRIRLGRHDWRYATVEDVRRHEAETDAAAADPAPSAG